MKKEILTTVDYEQITDSESPAPLPARTLLEHLQMAYDQLPAKVKNHRTVLVEFNNKAQRIVLYYLRDLAPGEQADPPATPVSAPEAPSLTAIDDEPDEEVAMPRPRPYMRNFDPDFKRPDINA